MNIIKLNNKYFIDVIFMIVLVLIMINFTFAYVSSEHTFYWWDYTTYQNLTESKVNDFLESPINALYTTWRSTNRDYSSIPTLLLIPFRLTFGNSRLVYILSIVLVYLLPFVLVIAAIATKLIPSHPRAVYYSTALLILLTPTVWASTLRGYVDTGAGLLIALAILIYLQDVKLNHWRQIVLIGFLLAAAPLFRRHFLYDCIAFFVAIALQTIIIFARQVQQEPRKAKHNLFKNTWRIILIITATIISLTILGWPFINKVISTNFGLMYASYEVNFREGFQYYGSAYGWVAWILAGLGFIAGIRTRVLAPYVGTFILIFGSFSLCQWVFAVKQVGAHYTSHFTLLIVLGLAAFIWTAFLTLKDRIRTVVLSFSGVYIIFNAVIGLAPVDILNNTPMRPTRFGMSQISDITGTKLSEIFSANYPPLYRPDYDEIVRLIAYLRSLGNTQSPIYIAASSSLLNNNLLESAEPSLHKHQQNLNFLPVPQVDSRDFYPLDLLLQAQYVVVATPFQYHLRPNEQNAIKVVVDAFNNNWEIAQDFTPLPVQFKLENGTVVKVYKRLHETSLKTALLTLKSMQQYIGTRPARKSDWVIINTVTGIQTWKYQDNHYFRINRLEKNEVDFAYLNRLSQDLQIKGRISYLTPQCPDILLSWQTIDAEGKVMNTKKLLKQPTDEPKFALPIKAQEAEKLVFSIFVKQKNKLTNECSLRVKFRLN